MRLEAGNLEEISSQGSKKHKSSFDHIEASKLP